MRRNFARIHSVMRFNDSGRVLALTTNPFAVYDDPAGGGEGGDDKPKTFTQAEVDEMTKGLKSKNTELLAKFKTASERYKNLPEDATSEEIAEALKEKREAAQKQAEAKGEYDKLVTQMGSRHTEEKSKLEGTIKTLTTRIQTKEKRLAVRDAVSEVEGDYDLLAPHILEQLDVEEDGDDYTVFVVNKKGEAIVGADGKKKTVAALVKEMAENPKYAGAFSAANVGGSGGRNGGGAGRSSGVDVVLTNEQAKDTPTYRSARERASKQGGQVVIRG
jgi:hypothetical protein